MAANGASVKVPAQKVIGEDICDVSTLPEPAQFSAKIMILHPFVFQQSFEGVPVEGRDLAFWDAPDIDEGLDSVCMENFDKILFASPVSSEGENPLHSSPQARKSVIGRY